MSKYPTFKEVLAVANERRRSMKSAPRFLMVPRDLYTTPGMLSELRRWIAEQNVACLACGEAQAIDEGQLCQSCAGQWRSQKPIFGLPDQDETRASWQAWADEHLHEIEENLLGNWVERVNAGMVVPNVIKRLSTGALIGERTIAYRAAELIARKKEEGPPFDVVRFMRMMAQLIAMDVFILPRVHPTMRTGMVNVTAGRMYLGKTALFEECRVVRRDGSVGPSKVRYVKRASDYRFVGRLLLRNVEGVGLDVRGKGRWREFCHRAEVYYKQMTTLNVDEDIMTEIAERARARDMAFEKSRAKQAEKAGDSVYLKIEERDETLMVGETGETGIAA